MDSERGRYEILGKRHHKVLGIATHQLAERHNREAVREAGTILAVRERYEVVNTSLLSQYYLSHLSLMYLQ